MLKILAKIVADESGATAIEYGLIAALVSVAAIGTLASLGSELISLFTKVSTAVDNAAAP